MVVEDQGIVIRVAIITAAGLPYEVHCSLKGCRVSQKGQGRGKSMGMRRASSGPAHTRASSPASSSSSSSSYA